MDQTDSLYKLL